MIRKLVFRLFVLAILVLSPILFPAVLLLEGGKASRADLAELYQWVWGRFRRGYP